MLIVNALFYYGIGEYKIVLGIHDGTMYNDCSEHFVSENNRVVDCYANGTVIVEAPFIQWYKKDIIKYVIEKGLPIELTYSCERGCFPPCGECLSCGDRKEFLNESY